MNFLLCVQLIVFSVVASQAFLCKEASLSCPVITRNHRRLKGFTLKTFHSASLISCSLQCQRNPRCISTNFRKISKTEGTCELNDRGVFPLEEGKELEYDEEAIYTQLYEKKVIKICLIYLNYWSLQWSGHRQKVCTYLFIYRNTSKKKRRKSYDLRFVTRRRISLRMDSLLGGSGILEHEILRPEILFYSWHIFGNVYLFYVRSKKFSRSIAKLVRDNLKHI